ncbi:MAG: hypothetical protein HWE27_17910 [Gammaproteobacteria bacterium]|nr:hypothetical protein [Gammaproteobacteria bacterium]
MEKRLKNIGEGSLKLSSTTNQTRSRKGTAELDVSYSKEPMIILRRLYLVIIIGVINISVFAQNDKMEIEMKQEKYIPPVMPDYPTSYEEVIKLLVPYYHEQRPLDYFFELFVIDTLEELPSETSEALIEFSEKHPTFFESSNGNWKLYVKTQLHLSETIEIAIWDLWITNSKKATDEGWIYHPWHYAQNFRDNYSVEGSRVDVWEGNSLNLAKERIRKFRNNR